MGGLIRVLPLDLNSKIVFLLIMQQVVAAIKAMVKVALSLFKAHPQSLKIVYLIAITQPTVAQYLSVATHQLKLMLAIFVILLLKIIMYTPKMETGMVAQSM